MKENQEIESLIKPSMEEYIYYCDWLMGYVDNFKEKPQWVGWTHGIHIRYKNKVTQQIVEAPYARIETIKDFDFYFWLEFLETTVEYKKVYQYIQENDISRDEVKKYLDDTYFESRKTIIPKVKKGDILQLRDSIFKSEMTSDKYWNPCYYYEDQMEYVYWMMEGNPKEIGCQAPTIFGGVKTKVVDIVKDEYGFVEIITDLFVIKMPNAFEKNQFKILHAEEEYEQDTNVSFLIDEFSFFEQSCKPGLFTPAEREKNKMKSAQQCFECMMEKR